LALPAAQRAVLAAIDLDVHAGSELDSVDGARSQELAGEHVAGDDVAVRSVLGHENVLAADRRAQLRRLLVCGHAERDVGPRERDVRRVDRLDLEDVAHAEEVGDRGAARSAVDLVGRADLDDAAVLHHRDAVGQRERLLLVVRDVDGGEPESLLQLAQVAAQAMAQAGVEVGQRLVEQHDRRLHHDAAGERDALHLATREQARAAVGEVLEPHELERLHHASTGLDLRGPLHGERERDVLEHGHVRPDRIGLEHHADVALVRRAVHALAGVEEHVVADRDAARGGRLEPGDAAHRAGLAAAGLPEQHHRLALADVEVEIAYGDIVAVLERQRFDLDLHQSFPSSSARKPYAS
jgi:hypothetical protein